MPRQIERCWRIFTTGFCFSVFGLGGVFMPVTIFPIIHLLSWNCERGNRRCQYVVHFTFRFFIWLMRAVGVIRYQIKGVEKLNGLSGRLIVANHPSLIDVVFLISLLPQASCVVKKTAWSNPFLAGIMWGTGYIQNQDPWQLIDRCVKCLERGDNLVIFPEATRSVPGKPIKLKRGAASVIVESGRPFVPVTITCEPIMLSKVQSWFQIPETPGHFVITVGDMTDPGPLLNGGELLSVANRRINRVLKDIFVGGAAA